MFRDDVSRSFSLDTTLWFHQRRPIKTLILYSSCRRTFQSLFYCHIWGLSVDIFHWCALVLWKITGKPGNIDDISYLDIFVLPFGWYIKYQNPVMPSPRFLRGQQENGFHFKHFIYSCLCRWILYFKAKCVSQFILQLNKYNQGSSQEFFFYSRITSPHTLAFLGGDVKGPTSIVTNITIPSFSQKKDNL